MTRFYFTLPNLDKNSDIEHFLYELIPKRNNRIYNCWNFVNNIGSIQDEVKKKCRQTI